MRIHYYNQQSTFDLIFRYPTVIIIAAVKSIIYPPLIGTGSPGAPGPRFSTSCCSRFSSVISELKIVIIDRATINYFTSIFLFVIYLVLFPRIADTVRPAIRLIERIIFHFPVLTGNDHKQDTQKSDPNFLHDLILLDYFFGYHVVSIVYF